MTGYSVGKMKHYSSSNVEEGNTFRKGKRSMGLCKGKRLFFTSTFSLTAWNIRRKNWEHSVFWLVVSRTLRIWGFIGHVALLSGSFQGTEIRTKIFIFSWLEFLRNENSFQYMIKTKNKQKNSHCYLWAWILPQVTMATAHWSFWFNQLSWYFEHLIWT